MPPTAAALLQCRQRSPIVAVEPLRITRVDVCGTQLLSRHSRVPSLWWWSGRPQPLWIASAFYAPQQLLPRGISATAATALWWSTVAVVRPPWQRRQRLPVAAEGLHFSVAELLFQQVETTISNHWSQTQRLADKKLNYQCFETNFRPVVKNILLRGQENSRHVVKKFPVTWSVKFLPLGRKNSRHVVKEFSTTWSRNFPARDRKNFHHVVKKICLLQERRAVRSDPAGPAHP